MGFFNSKELTRVYGR